MKINEISVGGALKVTTAYYMPGTILDALPMAPSNVHSNFTLQMKKLRIGKVNLFTQSHTASKWLSPALNGHFPISGVGAHSFIPQCFKYLEKI